jgi:hypothetical protein
VGRARNRAPATRVARDGLGNLAQAPEQVVELALDVGGRVDPVEQHLRPLDDAVAQLGEKLQPLPDEVVGAAARVVDDPVALGLRVAADQLRLALGVTQQPGCLGLGRAHDRMDALRGVPGKASIVETLHAPTVSPVASRQNRLFV